MKLVQLNLDRKVQVFFTIYLSLSLIGHLQDASERDDEYMLLQQNQNVD